MPKYCDGICHICIDRESCYKEKKYQEAEWKHKQEWKRIRQDDFRYNPSTRDYYDSLLRSGTEDL